ncbi:MAG TPA: site-2 protease family protein [Pyrinomonadaceae bacterium]|nr:site-2 protease family protein [Pyrinomonadaceae bacterium]
MADSVQVVPQLVNAAQATHRRIIWPTRREWVVHSLLFLITVITTIIAGIVIAEPGVDVLVPPPSSLTDYLLFVPQYYLRTMATLMTSALHHPHIIRDGLVFSATLLAILTAHELGHYLACQRYGVSATLPFFIPAPPLFLAGTFGAFIKIRSPIPTRRALFDIGLAGPLAGFVVTLPIALVGILSLQPAPPVVGEAIIFNDPLLFRLIAGFFGVQLTNTLTNPYYMSAWLGLLVTSLNLMPVGQLDGAHGTFAVLGQRMHMLIGRVAFVIMAVLAVLGYFWHGSPSGFLYALLLAIMVKVRHPMPQQMEPLGSGRRLVAVVTLIVFVLSFYPFPLTIT